MKEIIHLPSYGKSYKTECGKNYGVCEIIFSKITCRECLIKSHDGYKNNKHFMFAYEKIVLTVNKDEVAALIKKLEL